MNDAFQKCNAVSDYLQTSSIDFLAATAAIDNLRATLRSTRTDESYACYEKQAADLLLKVNVVRSVTSEEGHPLRKRARKLPPKLCDGQSVLTEFLAFQIPSSKLSDSVASDLKVSFHFAFIDTLLQAIDDRFGKKTCEVLTWMSSFTPKHWHAQNKKLIENLCHTVHTVLRTKRLGSMNSLLLTKDEKPAAVSETC